MYFFNGGVADVPIFGETVVTFAHGDFYGSPASYFEQSRYELYTTEYFRIDYEQLPHNFTIVGPYLVELRIDRTLLSYAGTYYVHYYYSRFNPSFIINVVRKLDNNYYVLLLLL